MLDYLQKKFCLLLIYNLMFTGVSSGEGLPESKVPEKTCHVSDLPIHASL